MDLQQSQQHLMAQQGNDRMPLLHPPPVTKPRVATAANDKENQANAATVTAGVTAKRPAETPSQEAVKAPQEKANDKPAATASDTTMSPYRRRMAELRKIRKDAGENEYIMVILSDMEQVLQQAGLVDDDMDDDLEEDEYMQAVEQLSQKQIDDHFHAMIVPKKLCTLQKTLYDDLMYADHRNERGSGMVCLNTYSSYCMYPVIYKQLTAAQKLVNAAMKQITPNQELPGLAQNAFTTSLATILAAHNMDHWRHDTEEPEEVDKVAKRVVKLAKELLVFTNAELGLKDAYSRTAVVHHLEAIADDWNECCSVKMSFGTAKNRKGLGRQIVDAADPPLKKKAKTVFPVAVAATSITSNSTNLPSVTNYFSNLHDKLSKRVKTCLQLAVKDQTTTKVEHVVVSGASDLKKMHHLLAYLSGASPTFQYHSQRGANTKGCYFELSAPGHTACWIGEKKLAKQAQAAGADFAEDKSVKIVQIFQGLNCSANGGIVYDSSVAESINTASALVFVTPTGGRFSVQAKAIAPAKSLPGKAIPMPRIVTYSELDENNKSGWGQSLAQLKRVLQGDRSDPRTMAFFGKVCHLTPWAHPICSDEGKDVCKWGGVEDSSVPGMAGMFEKMAWKKETVMSAGPPACVKL